MLYPDIETLNPSQLVAYFMSSSYLYYKKDKQVLSDEDFDRLCKRLLENWDKAKHPHKRRIKRKDLEAGTGFAIKNYPNRVIGAAELWYEMWEAEKKGERPR
jgi:NAD-dependent DNA ligase